MNHFKTLLLLTLLPAAALAQSPASSREQALQSILNRKGWYAGIGLYYADMQTFWQYQQTPPAQGVPFYDASQGFGHDLSRVLLAIGVERKSIFGTPALRDGVFVSHYNYNGDYTSSTFDPTYNFVDIDFGGDVLIGPSGKTYAQWLNDGQNEISSGGFSAGGSAYIRLNWVFILSRSLRITAFSAGLGGQFLHIRNKGNGPASSPLVKDFNYENGWNENITTFYLSAGTLGIETGNLSIIPEVRVLSLNSASTSLKPARLTGSVETEDKPAVLSYGLKIMKRF